MGIEHANPIWLACRLMDPQPSAISSFLEPPRQLRPNNRRLLDLLLVEIIMGKKKRGHPDVEELLARPWCYYCMYIAFATLSIANVLHR
jgi:hypothetical protein